MIVLPNGKVVIFWRAKCRMTGREQNFRSHMAGLLPFDEMQVWVTKFFRNLDLLEVRPWDVEDDHRINYPVPVQHVKFDVPIPDLAKPDPRRISVLIQRKRLLNS